MNPNFKKQLKFWQRDLARNVMVFFFWLITFLPYGVIKFLMRIFFWIAFHFTVRLKTISRETLTIALGREKTPEEIEEISRGCFEALGTGITELLYYFRFPEKLKGRYTIVGKEHLDRALAQGRGVVAATAHFGNFPLMMISLVQSGYSVNVLMRRIRDQKAQDILTSIMTRLNVKFIFSLPRRECVSSCLRALRKNEILFMLMDQNFGSEGGVYVDFFGQKAATAPGPVVFALRANAPVMTIFNVRGQDGISRIHIEPEVKMEHRENYDATILVNVSRLTNIIERYIRKYPTHWGWMHRRFKSQSTEGAAPGAPQGDPQEHLEETAERLIFPDSTDRPTEAYNRNKE